MRAEESQKSLQITNHSETADPENFGPISEMPQHLNDDKA
jgi:hypothetical protein